jgi:phosphomannomutase
MDCCNGVGALHSPAFLRERLGCEVFPVLDRPDGKFEREPEPLPTHLGAVCDAVREHNCHIGFAQDPDGDRLAVIDEHGRPIGEDLTLALAVEQVLSQHERGLVVVNLSSSKSIDHVAGRHGCEVVRTRIGEINVVSRMLELRAVAGGEPNGGVIVPDIHPCRDSYAGMALILELLSATGKTVSALRAEIPAFTVVKDKLPIRGDRVPGVLRELRRIYPPDQTNLLDGVYVDFEHGWLHVRPSNTESVIRVLAESDHPEGALAIAEEAKAHIRRVMD